MRQNFDNFIHSAGAALKKFFSAVRDYAVKAKLELIVLAAMIAADLISKAIVGATMEPGATVTLIPNFLNIAYTHNDAAAFGSSFGLDKLLGPVGVRVVFILISLAAIVLFSVLLYKSRGRHRMIRVAYAMIVGGAFGNLVDRVAFGYVRDFIQFVYFGLEIFGQRSFAIFNIADASLVVGVIVFAVYFIFIYKDKEPEKKAPAKAPAPADDEDDLPPETRTKSENKPAKAENKSAENNAGSGDLPASDPKQTEAASRSADETKEGGSADENDGRRE